MVRSPVRRDQVRQEQMESKQISSSHGKMAKCRVMLAHVAREMERTPCHISTPGISKLCKDLEIPLCMGNLDCSFLHAVSP